MKLYIGTSGWQHSEMKEIFYPTDLPGKDWLSYYMDHFRTVEINTSFYHMKLASTYRKWKKIAPKGFIFSAKLFRYITHRKRLIMDRESIPVLENDLRNLSALGANLGPILIQLPPSARFNPERLADFLRNLESVSKKIFGRPHRFSIEFRHSSWFKDETFELLRKHKIASCISDSPDWPTQTVMTADWTYVRFHGRPLLFSSPYGKNALAIWSEKLLDLKPKDLFIYFNNTSGLPTENALAMNRILLDLIGGGSTQELKKARS